MVFGKPGKKLGLAYNSETKQLTFEFSSPNRAGVVRPAKEDEHQKMLMLVMQVMLNSHA